ncbi:MAG: hypothetical protein COA78_08820 [Blastopirellula sp.]|nr:MAG: hypothetical protein COA78_08820 [Blastopirellula sp.]
MNTDQPTINPSRNDRLLHWGILGAVLLSAAMALTPNVADPDMWGHVQYGRDVLREGLPATTSYSFTAEGYPWVNHENLSEIVMAVGVDTVGPVGLLIGKCLLGLSILGLMLWKYERAKTPLIVSCLAVLLVATNFTNHWNVRPQLASFFSFALLIVLLDYCFSGWHSNWHLPWFQKNARRDSNLPLQDSHPKMRWLWLCVPLFFLWTNAHGGFIAGYAVFGLYLVCRLFELCLTKGTAGQGMMRRLVLMCFVGGLTTLINPYGPGLHQWLLMSLGSPRPEITEWHQLYSLDMHSLAFFALMATTAVTLLLSRKSLDFTQLVVMSAVTWQASMHQRHIPFLAMLFGFWVVPHLRDVWAQYFEAKETDQESPSAADDLSPAKRRMMLGALAVVYLILGVSLYPRLSTMPVPRDAYPVSAVEFIEENNLKGRLIVTYNWAQYAIAALAADGDTAVQFDGRYRTCYPQNVVDMHFDFILGLSDEYRFREEEKSNDPLARILEYNNPELVLIDRGQPHSLAIMNANRDQWSLLYQDQIAEVWGRSELFDSLESPRFLSAAQRVTTALPQTGAVNWPALPKRQTRSFPLAQIEATR